MTPSSNQPVNEPSALEQLLRRAIAAGLATRQEAEQALAQLAASELPYEAAADHHKEIRASARQQADQLARYQPPQDEQELLEWMATATAAAPWAAEAKATALSPYGSQQLLFRVTDKNSYVFRMGISNCPDEESQAEFDDNFDDSSLD